MRFVFVDGGVDVGVVRVGFIDESQAGDLVTATAVTRRSPFDSRSGRWTIPAVCHHHADEHVGRQVGERDEADEFESWKSHLEERRERHLEHECPLGMSR